MISMCCVAMKGEKTRLGLSRRVQYSVFEWLLSHPDLQPCGRGQLLCAGGVVGAVDASDRRGGARHVHDRHSRGQCGDTAIARPDAGDAGAGGRPFVAERRDYNRPRLCKNAPLAMI